MLSNLEAELKEIRAYEEQFRRRGYKIDVQPHLSPMGVMVTATSRDGKIHRLGWEYHADLPHPVNYTVDSLPRADLTPPVIEWFLRFLPSTDP